MSAGALHERPCGYRNETVEKVSRSQFSRAVAAGRRQDLNRSPPTGKESKRAQEKGRPCRQEKKTTVNATGRRAALQRVAFVKDGDKVSGAVETASAIQQRKSSRASPLTGSRHRPLTYRQLKDGPKVRIERPRRKKTRRSNLEMTPSPPSIASLVHSAGARRGPRQ